MINQGNRSQGIPLLISENATNKLERVPLTEKLFQEDWLQKLIFENPQILPVDNLDIGFTPLISLGREINTKVGFIDNLFISPDGYLTIVETKLWRNPEAKREVVGQIIDYAKELTTWSYSHLNNEIKNKNPKGLGILELINEFDFLDEESETKLIDNIERNLKRGRFLLLIVGDGIRESVEDMITYLTNSAQLLFTLGLIELQVYKKEDELIVVPNLITRTKEITRAVIKIENNSDNIVDVVTDFSSDEEKSSRRSSLSEDDFFEKLLENRDSKVVGIAKKILTRFHEEGYILEWKKSTFIFKTLDPKGSGTRITIFLVNVDGNCHIDYAGQQIERLGLERKLAIDFCNDTLELFENVKTHPKYLSCWDKWVDLNEFEPKLEEFIGKCNQFVKNIEKAS